MHYKAEQQEDTQQKDIESTGDWAKYEDEGREFIRVKKDIDYSRRTVVSLKASDCETIQKFSVNNGVMFLAPTCDSTWFGGQRNFQFYYWIFQNVPGLKTLIFYARKNIYRVPIEKFVGMWFQMESTNSLRKKVYIPEVALENYIVSEI